MKLDQAKLRDTLVLVDRVMQTPNLLELLASVKGSRNKGKNEHHYENCGTCGKLTRWIPGQEGDCFKCFSKKQENSTERV